MALHLLKLCVGAESVAQLDARVVACREAHAAAGSPCECVHTTRMVPKRAADLLAGGSLFWVIKGQISARQRLRDIRPLVGSDGIHRCNLVLAPELVAVTPRPCRPFQGWRYLENDARPDDLAATPGLEAMPEQLRFTLRELCLL